MVMLDSDVSIRDTVIPIAALLIDDVAVPVEFGTCIVGNVDIVETAPAPEM